MNALRGLDWTGACGVASRDAAGGVPVLLPADAEQVALCLRRAAEHGARLRPVSGLGEPHGHDLPGAFLSLERLRGVVEWHPHEGTVTARAGTTLAEIEEVAAADGWRVLPQVPDPARTSLGGAVSAGASGLERARHGPLRHHLLGARLALPSGDVVKSGSRLVKNVTGYDLHRAACGARGTMGVVVEASLRLVPLPRAAWSLRLDGRPWSVVAAAASALRDSRVELDLLRSCPRAGAWDLVAFGSGRPETCAAMLRKAAEAVPEAIVGGPLPWDEVSPLWQALRTDEARCGATVEIGCLPTACTRLVDGLASSGLDIALVDHALARVLLRAADEAAPALRRLVRAEASAACGARTRGGLTRLAASLQVPRDPVAAALEARLRAALDPAGVLARKEAR